MQKNEYKESILSPSDFNDIEEIKNAIKLNPRYVGPGSWLKLMKELYHQKNNQNRETA